MFILGLDPVAQEICGHHRRDQACHQQREQHSHRHSQTELLEELPRDARHKADRQEDRDDGKADSNNGHADFGRGLFGRLIGGLAHLDVSDDILNFDDGVIHQNAGYQCNAEQGNCVERKAQVIHHDKSRDDRQRQCNRRNDRRAPIFQEQEDHNNGQSRTLIKRIHRRVIVTLGIDRRVVNQRKCHAGIGLGKRCDHLLGVIAGHQIAFATGPEHTECYHGLTVEHGESRRINRAVAYRAQVIQSHRTAGRKCNWYRRQFFDG